MRSPFAINAEALVIDATVAAEMIGILHRSLPDDADEESQLRILLLRGYRMGEISRHWAMIRAHFDALAIEGALPTALSA